MGNRPGVGMGDDNQVEFHTTFLPYQAVKTHSSLAGLNGRLCIINDLFLTDIEIVGFCEFAPMKPVLM